MRRHFQRFDNAAGSTRAGVLVLAASFIFGICCETRGQVGATAVCEARQALADVQRTFGHSSDWDGWLRPLALKDVEYELRAGDRGEPKVLVSASRQIRAGSSHQFRDARFQHLAAALDRRAQELSPVPPSEWRAACRERAEEYVPVSMKVVESSSRELADRLRNLERRIALTGVLENEWREFLHWPQMRSLLTASAPDPALLDRLELRWQGATSVWDAPELLDASQAAQAFIRQLRGQLARESREQHATAWNAIGTLLASGDAFSSDKVGELAALVQRREMIGQASPLTASIRREFSRPNLIVEARLDWLQSALARRIDERYEVDDVIAGTRSIGWGTLAASLGCRFLPSSAAGQAVLFLQGESVAQTRGSSRRVEIDSRATTRINGEKLFTLDALGLHAEPAVASATTSIQYENISARRRWHRTMAIERVNALRPQAEHEAAGKAQRALSSRMDVEGTKLVDQFNEFYRRHLCDPQLQVGRPAPEARLRSAANTLRWECRLEGPAAFTVPGSPPPFASSADLVVCLAASAVQERCLASLSGRTLRDEQLSAAIGAVFGEALPGERAPQDFLATFAPHACDFQFAAGQILASFHITSFQSADAEYPAMTVDARYGVAERAGDLTLVRQGSLRVRPLAPAQGTAATSGRQQTLRLAVQRKLNKAFADTYVWPGPTLPVASGQDTKLRIERAQVDGGWLQLALVRR